LPKWIICGTHGTLTCDCEHSTARWFDPAVVQPLTVIEGAAIDRKYGNEDRLPWQEKTIEIGSRPRGAFSDNVYGVLRRGEPMHVTPQSAAEVMRVIGMIRRGTRFPGRISRAAGRIEEEAKVGQP